MLKKIFTYPYVLAGIAVFVFLVIMGLWLEFSLSETLLAASVLSVVGTISVWWKQHIW